MLFSIITVTFNAAATLPATLRSVTEQTCRDFEYIVMDGASRDQTVALAHAAAIEDARIISEPDRGLYDAMNKAQALAQGEYLIFLNAGDAFASKETLAEYAEAIKANNRPGMVYGQTLLVDAEGNAIGPRHLTAPERLTFKSFARGMLVCHQAMAVRRDLAQPYDMQYRYSADFDWAVKVLRKSPGNVLIPHATIHYLSEGLTTANHRRSLKERFRIMCKHYGTASTIFRHIGFTIRHLRHKFGGLKKVS
jgi:glycosyltransferase involved in cell wall biosynthesis